MQGARMSQSYTKLQTTKTKALQSHSSQSVKQEQELKRLQAELESLNLQNQTAHQKGKEKES